MANIHRAAAKTNVVAVVTLFGFVAIVILGCCVSNNEVLGATIDSDKRQHEPAPALATATVDKEASSGVMDDIGLADDKEDEEEVVALDAPVNSDETDDYTSVEQQEGGVGEVGSEEAVDEVVVVPYDDVANEGKWKRMGSRAWRLRCID